MKFSVKVGELLETLDAVSGTIDKKGINGTSDVFLQAFKREGTSSVFLYSTTLTAESARKLDTKVEEEGQTLINPVQLRAGLAHRDLEAMAHISVRTEGVNRQILIQIGRAKINLAYDPEKTDLMARRMRDIPFREPSSYTIPGKELTEFVKRGMFCIPKDGENTHRYTMSGMQLIATARGYEARATDGHIAVRIVVKGEQGTKPMDAILIPYSSLPSLSRLVKKEETVKVIAQKQEKAGAPAKLFFKLGENTFFGTRLLEGTFPNIEAVLAGHTPDFSFTVDRELLKFALERASAFDEKRFALLELNGDTLRIGAQSSTVKSEEISDEVPVVLGEGMPDDVSVKVQINLDYLKNIASGSDQELLTLRLSDYNEKTKANRPLLVEDKTDRIDSTYAIMPVVLPKG